MPTATRQQARGGGGWGNSFWTGGSNRFDRESSASSGAHSYGYSAPSYSTSYDRDGESTFIDESSAYDASTLNDASTFQDGSTFRDGASTVLDNETYYEGEEEEENDGSSAASSDIALEESIELTKKDAANSGKPSAFSRIVSALSDVDRNLGSMLRPGSRLRQQRTTSLSSSGRFDGTSTILSDEGDEIIRHNHHHNYSSQRFESSGRELDNVPEHATRPKRKPFISPPTSSYDSDEKKEPEMVYRSAREDNRRRGLSRQTYQKKSQSSSDEDSFFTRGPEDMTYCTREQEDDTLFTRDEEEETLFTRDLEAETIFTRDQEDATLYSEDLEDDTLFTRDQATLATDYGFDDDLSGMPDEQNKEEVDERSDRVIEEFGGFFSCFSLPTFPTMTTTRAVQGRDKAQAKSENGSEGSYSIASYDEKSNGSNEDENVSMSGGEASIPRAQRSPKKSGFRRGLSNLKSRYGLKKLYYTTEESSTGSDMDQSHIYLMMTNARRKRNIERAAPSGKAHGATMYNGSAEMQRGESAGELDTGRPNAIAFGRNRSPKNRTKSSSSKQHSGTKKPSTAELLGAAYVMEKWLHESKEAIKRGKDSSGFTLSPMVQKRRMAAKTSLMKLAQHAAHQKQRSASRR